LFEDICFAPEDIRDQLRPGMQIELVGWGTKDGLFYTSIGISGRTEPPAGSEVPLYKRPTVRIKPPAETEVPVYKRRTVRIKPPAQIIPDQ